MKKLIQLYLLLVSVCVLAQNKEAIAIKIYLEGAETGKNISDAKVTLEGFEIPEIVGKYDKKGKYYYFTEIPVGYNTVMAYHKKYNEKGFQDVDGLPKEVKLKLYDPLNVSYSFEKPVLSRNNCCNNGKKVNYAIMPKYLKEVINSQRKILKPSFRYIYREDPNNIAIIMKPNANKDSIRKVLDCLFLKEINYNEYGSQKFVIDHEKGCLSDGSYVLNPSNAEVLILKKKDDTKFKRFNSKEIKKLREQGLVVASLTNRILEYYGDTFFNSKIFYKKYEIINNTFALPRITEQAFCSTLEKDYRMFYVDNKVNTINDVLPSKEDDRIYSVYFVISKNMNDGIGLGILDNMSTNSSNLKSYIFTNSYK